MEEARFERWWRALVVAWAALHVFTLFGELPEPDAALYASIARWVAVTGNWADLLAYNIPWLDKPHFPFWTMAASFKVFGVSVWAARLPALACFFLGVWATWRLGLELFSRRVAQVAVLVVFSAQHLVMSNADTRAEPWLVGLLTCAVWLTVRVARAKERWVRALVVASACTAAAMMTKGPFVLIPVASVAVIPSLLKREPVRWGRWALAVLLVAVFITPELWALWSQFEGRGVRWFLWDSQFGRFTNTGPIRGRGDPTFFFHTVLWAFLPWSLLLYAAVVSWVRRRAWRANETVAWVAALPLGLVFTLSRFQLPHYLNVLFPFFALGVAAWLVDQKPRVFGVQAVVVGGTALFVGVLLVMFGVPGALAIAAALVLGVLFSLRLRDAVLVSALGSLLINVAYEGVFVPATLRYQVGGAAAELANGLPPRRTAMLDLSSHAFAFHLHERAEWWSEVELRGELPKMPVRLLIRRARLDELQPALGLEVTVLGEWDSFPATTPTLAFLDAARRPGVVDHWVLADVQLAR
ncbi:MAG: glycosyltransferase family 39 protein [Myxococcaceae bacterium]